MKSIKFLVLFYTSISSLFSYSQELEIPEIDSRKSLIITDHKVLNELVKTYDFGEMLGQVGIWTGTYMAWNLSKTEKELGLIGRQGWGAGKFVDYTFLTAITEQQNHSALLKSEKTRSQALGGEYDRGKDMNYIMSVWSKSSYRKDIKQFFESRTRPEQLRNSPFRLLAVVNRMDLAGDMDDRGTTHTTSFPRALGEVHLVYGFTDESFEKKGLAYPGVFVMSYRLPSLKWVNGQLENEFTENILDPENSVKEMNSNYIRLIDHQTRENKYAWKYKMHTWARLWSDLSKHPPQSTAYDRKLKRILHFAIHPRNFLQLRSNIQINAKEFELREWYTLQTNQALIARKPRDEVYKCQSGQKEITQIVNYFWKESDIDVDVKSRSLYARTLGGGKDGYTIPRDGGTDSEEMLSLNRKELADSKSLLETILHDPNDPDRDRISSFSNCGDTEVPNSYPFEMASDGTVIVAGKRALFVPPFARVEKNHVWKLASKVMGQETKFYEEKRHAFAIRSCSGCHGAEAATFGFHIQPRTANNDSELSGFLTGTGENKFTHNGVSYKYTELKQREDWLIKSFNKKANLFDSLLRRDK